MASSKKISELNSTTSLNNGDYLNLVVNGQNIKITVEAFTAALNFVGSIVADGSVTAVSVLDKNGSVNTIRGIESGQGISASVSAENGITVAHNFTQDTVGSPLTFNLSSANPTIASLEAGDGIAINETDTHLEISASGITTASNVVIVNELSDFPAPVAGVITLLDDTMYLISAKPVELGTNRLVMGDDTVLAGSDYEVSRLTYTGTGTMITCTSAGMVLKNCGYVALNGTFLDYQASGGDLHINHTQVQAATLGTIGDLDYAEMSHNNVKCTTDGFTFTGTLGYFVDDVSTYDVDGGTALDFGTAVFNDGVSMHQTRFDLAAGTFALSGASSSANIASGALGTVIDCRFDGVGTPLNTITNSDSRWQFNVNDDIGDTRSDGLLSLVNNATETVISVAGTPVLIAGTWNQERSSQFTTTTAGRMTYNGGKDMVSSVTASITARPVSGTNLEISFHLYKNGSPIANAEQRNTISSTGTRNTTLLWELEMESGDYLELYTANEDNTNNVLVENSIFRVN